MEQPSYYAILPANVRYDKDLKPMEKIMFAELTALSNKDGFCSASNHYFADLYDADESTVSRWIKRLADKGYVSILIIRNDKKAIIGRHVFTIPIDKKVNTLLTKKSIPSPQKSQYPIDKKVIVNTTSINTTSINRESAPAKNLSWMEVSELLLQHSQGEGKAEWEYMKANTGYQGDGRDVFSAWAGKNKSAQYALQAWKENFPKLQTWMQTQARANLKAHPRPFQQAADIAVPVANFHRAKR